MFARGLLRMIQIMCMKRGTLLICFVLLALNQALAQSTLFTYQGRLTDNSTNFAGTGQFKFALVTSTNSNHQATATAVDTSGFITSYVVTYGGNGYSTPPGVTISGGGGFGAAATANITGGSVTSITVNNPGSGYTSTPTVTIAPPPPNFSYVTFWSNDGTSVAGSEPSAAVAVPVNNGLFTVGVGDTTLANMAPVAGSVFAQPNLQLRIWFSDGVNGFAALSPLQNLTAVPYAAYASGTSNLLGPLPGSQVSGTLSATQLSGTLPLAQLPAAVVTNNSSSVNLSGVFTGSYSGNGTGLTNVNGALPWQVVSGTAQTTQPNMGYVVTNNSLVTLTLPTAPNMGDIVRLSGVGGSGWKLGQNAGQYVAAASFPGSQPGAAWIPRGSAQSWQAVASSADGTKVLAAVSGGLLYTSTDSGMSWTPQTNGIANAGVQNWSSVASSADGTKLVAVVYGGQVYTSGDSGATWMPQANAGTRNWYAVASSADATKIAVVVSSGQIFVSTNSGIFWNAHGTSQGWEAIAASADGTMFVATAYGGQIYTSPDSGSTWFAHDNSRNWIPVASSSDGAKLVAAVYGGAIYTSTNSGANWSPQTTGVANGGNQNWVSAASSSDGSHLVLSANGGQIYTSTDSGATWTARDSSRVWSSVASSSDGTKLVAVVSGGQVYTSIPSTTLGTSGFLQGNQNSALELQFVGNGEFLTLSHEGLIQAH